MNIDPRNITPELLEMDIDQLTELEAKIRLAYTEEIANDYRSNIEYRERRDKKRRRWIIFPLFVLLGLLLGLLVGLAAWYFIPNCPEKPMYEKSLLVIDSLNKTRINDSLMIKTLIRELKICQDKLIAPATNENDKPSKATTKGKKGTGNKHKKPTQKTLKSDILVPPPPPPTKPFNKDSADLFNNNDKGDLSDSDNGDDDTGGNKSRKKKSFAWEVVPESSGSSQSGWVKPTVYGLEGRKSRPTNYGVPLRLIMKND